MRKVVFVDYKLLNSKGESSLENKLDNLLASDVDEILVQPVLMSEGYEAKKLRERVSVYENRFSKIEFGSPVLGTKESLNFFADLLIKETGFLSEYEYLLVGHGLNDNPNREYAALSDNLHSKGFMNVEVICLKGECSLASYLEKAQKKTKRKPVLVFPLLINLGNHIKQDIFGTEESEEGEKSVVQILEENGFTVVKNIVPLSSFDLFKARYLDENYYLSNKKF